MKETTNFKLKMPEVSDGLSAAPLNENAQMIDTALHALASSVPGKVMMAFGSYTGDGTRTRMIATPGFTPQVVLMRRVDTALVGAVVTEGENGTASSNAITGAISVEYGWCVWMGEGTMNAQYSVWGSWDGVSMRKAVNSLIGFSAENGSLTWTMPEYPSNFTSVREDNGPMAMNNLSGKVYQWIALGTAQE